MYNEVPVFQVFSYTLYTLMDFESFTMSQDIILSVAHLLKNVTERNTSSYM